MSLLLFTHSCVFVSSCSWEGCYVWPSCLFLLTMVYAQFQITLDLTLYSELSLAHCNLFLCLIFLAVYLQFPFPFLSFLCSWTWRMKSSIKQSIKRRCWVPRSVPFLAHCLVQLWVLTTIYYKMKLLSWGSSLGIVRKNRIKIYCMSKALFWKRKREVGDLEMCAHWVTVKQCCWETGLSLWQNLLRWDLASKT